MRLEHYFNIPEAPPQELLSLIVFAVERQIGLVVSEITNTVEISTEIDTETFKQKGILGSTIVEGHSVLILDIHGLIELAYPSWYKKFFISKFSAVNTADGTDDGFMTTADLFHRVGNFTFAGPGPGRRAHPAPPRRRRRRP